MSSTFSLSYDGSTLTATLNTPLSTLPTVTFTVCGQAVIATPATTYGVTTAMLAVKVHPSVVDLINVVAVNADGYDTAWINIGGSQAAEIGLQAYIPTGETSYTVAPAGAGSRAYLEAYYATAPANIESLLADVSTAVNILTDMVFNVLLPALQSASYTPITLTADQQNALTDIKAGVLPNLYTKLGNAYPSGGTKQLQYQHYAEDIAKTYQSFQNYMSDLASIPNLA